MKVLLATDGSDCANAAVDFLARFPFPPGSEVVALAVLHRVIIDDELKQLSDAQWSELTQTRDASEAEAKRLLGAVIERLAGVGWSASMSLRTGHPPDEILAAADELEVDLVVMGSHGLTGLRKFLLGSVSDHVLGAASCSVLIVKEG